MAPQPASGPLDALARTSAAAISTTRGLPTMWADLPRPNHTLGKLRNVTKLDRERKSLRAWPLAQFYYNCHSFEVDFLSERTCVDPLYFG